MDYGYNMSSYDGVFYILYTLYIIMIIIYNVCNIQSTGHPDYEYGRLFSFQGKS